MKEKKSHENRSFSENKSITEKQIRREEYAVDAVRFVRALDNVKRINEEFNNKIDALCNNPESFVNSFMNRKDIVFTDNSEQMTTR